MSKLHMGKEISVLLGIIAGFTFLIAFFVGIGVATDTLVVIGGLFGVVAVALALLLLGGGRRNGEPR